MEYVPLGVGGRTLLTRGASGSSLGAFEVAPSDHPTSTRASAYCRDAPDTDRNLSTLDSRERYRRRWAYFYRLRSRTGYCVLAFRA
jgi:hypothetical protein